MLEHFQKNISSVAVPLGTSALDEASVWTKAKTKARSYLPSKPDRYAIRFYMTVGSRCAYVSNIFNNQSGNTTGETAARALCRVHREMCTPFNTCLGTTVVL